MAKIKIGKIPVYKGEYDNNTTYNRLNQVTYLGTTFLSIVDDNLGHPPAEKSEDGGEILYINTNYWDIVAKGIDNVEERTTTDNSMGYKILKKNKSFIEQVTEENTIYEIRYNFTLTEDITIPANCVLKFDGGSLSGAYTITGNNTGIDAGLVKIFGTNIIIDGTWNVNESYSQWIPNTEDFYNNCIVLLSKLSDTIRLEGNKTFRFKKDSTCEIHANIVYSSGEKATLYFDDYNGAGNNLYGLNLISTNALFKNLIIIENFDPKTENQPTIGCALVTSHSTRDTDVIVTIENCEFTGSFSSSCFASSCTTEVYIKNCKFYDIYVADHLIYSSINTKNFVLENINVDNCTKSAGMFKVRESPKFKLFRAKDLYITNPEGYVFYFFPLPNNSIKPVIELDNINVYTDNDHSNRSKLFAFINEGTLGTISLTNSNIRFPFGNGEEYPLFYRNGYPMESEIESITISNSVLEGNKLLELKNVPLYVYKCNIKKNVTSAIYSGYNAEFKDCKIDVPSGNSIFSSIKNLKLEGCVINTSGVTYLINIKYSTGITDGNYPIVSIKNCNINKINRNIFVGAQAETPFYFFYVEENNNIVRNSSDYDLIIDDNTNTTLVPNIILNRISGTFSQKPPIPTAIYKGYRFFCTDKQTTEGATDGIEIIHKGNNVWVDALGRQIS